VDSTGEHLRSAREAAGISLEEVAARLKRPVHQVQAVENNQFDGLGGGVYVRGFLRNYCKLVHVDPEALLATLPAEFQSQPTVFAEHPANSLKVAASAQRRRFGGGVFAAIAVVVVIAWLFGNSDPGTEVSPPNHPLKQGEGPDVHMIDLGSPNPTENEVQPIPSDTAVPTPSDVAIPAPADKVVPPPSALQEVQAGDRPAAIEVTVTLRASDRCWVYIEREGETYRDVTLFPDENWVVSLHPGDRVTLGNAGVIWIRTPSGDWVGPLGADKKVLRHWNLVNNDGSLHLPPIPDAPVATPSTDDQAQIISPLLAPSAPNDPLL